MFRVKGDIRIGGGDNAGVKPDTARKYRLTVLFGLQLKRKVTDSTLIIPKP